MKLYQHTKVLRDERQKGIDLFHVVLALGNYINEELHSHKNHMSKCISDIRAKRLSVDTEKRRRLLSDSQYQHKHTVLP